MAKQSDGNDMQPDEKSEKPASARPLHREHVDDFQRLRLVPRSVRVTDSTLINRLPDRSYTGAYYFWKVFNRIAGQPFQTTTAPRSLA